MGERKAKAQTKCAPFFFFNDEFFFMHFLLIFSLIEVIIVDWLQAWRLWSGRRAGRSITQNSTRCSPRKFVLFPDFQNSSSFLLNYPNSPLIR